MSLSEKQSENKKDGEGRWTQEKKSKSVCSYYL